MITLEKKKQLVIVGDSAFAEIAYEYFTYDSPYEVKGFAVERDYLKKESLFGLPVVPFDEMQEKFPPAAYDVYVAVVYTQLNRLRKRLSDCCKDKGYSLASYISSRAFVWRNVTIGEHCFIFENNVVQPFVCLGDNVVLWSGNHIGHHSSIADNCFISSHVVVSGFCDIGENCFFGVNSTVANNVTVAKDCWIGPGSVISKDVEQAQLMRAPTAEAAKVSALRFFKVKE